MERKRAKLLSKNGFAVLLTGLTLLGMLGVTSAAVGAEVKGVVTDASTGEALVGANVFVKGTNVGAATDIDGRFSFNYDGAAAYSVVVAFIGYKTQEMKIAAGADASNLDVKLREDVFQSEAIVVTGIASRTSKAVAEVAVSRLDVSKLTEDNSYTSMNQLVAGKVTGVQIKNASGNVGGGFRFHVRSGGGINGNEQPVIYIDGVRVDNSRVSGFGAGGQGLSTMSDINPDDIANIEFLKGSAGAAMYGTSGSNGVVLITTKKGSFDASNQGKVKIDYKFVGGQNSQSYDYSLDDFLTADDANAIFRDGPIRQHSLSASGGNNFMKYYTSYENRDEDGIVFQNYQRRQNVRANLDIFPSDNLSFSVTGGFTLNKIGRPQNDNNTLGYLGNTLLFSNSYLFTDSAAIRSLEDEWKNNRFIGSVQASWTPIKNFEARASIGIDNSDNRQDRTKSPNFRFGSVSTGERSIYHYNNNQLTYDLNARYSYNFAGFKATSIVGSQIFNRTIRTSTLQSRDFDTALITDIGAGATFTSVNETLGDNREAGIFTEHQLNYNDTYFMTLGLRNDFASSVGSGAPSIVYPKASAAVRLDRFNGTPGMFNLLKFRVAYGETGVLPGTTDPIPLLWAGSVGGYGTGAVLSGIGNEGIEPERIKELELGVDAEILNDYAVEFTYFQTRAQDSIIDFRDSPSTGKTASAKPLNVGGIDGSGFEVLFQGSPIRSRNFSVDFSFVNSYQKNEVTDLGGAQPIFDAFDLNVIKEGLPKHEMYVQEVVGAMFDENGVYTGPELSAERVAHGNPVPNYTGSFNLNFNVMKNLRVSVLSDWATGLKVFNNTDIFAARFGNKPAYNRQRALLGQITQDGVDALTPGTSEYIAAAEEFARMEWRYDTNYIEDADYFKLREVSVSYNLSSVLPSLGLQNYVKSLVIGFSGLNLLTNSKYSGADPEVNFRGSRDLSRGQDFLTLMNPRVVNFNLRLSL